MDFNFKCNYFIIFPSRILDSLRTQPPTQRLLSLSVPWHIRFTAWCVHVVMPVKISPPFFSSCVRRKGSSNVGLHPPVHSLVSSWLCTGLSQQGAFCPEDHDYSFSFFFQVVRRPRTTRALLSFWESHHWSFLDAALPFKGTKEVFHKYMVYNERTFSALIF